MAEFQTEKFKAATLTEVMIVIAILAIVATLSYGSILNYYRTTILDADLSAMVTVIRRTRQLAVSNATGSFYSIKFLSDRYVVFPGTMYSPSGGTNENEDLENGVIVDTTFTNDEINFENFTGRVTAGGSITVTAYGITKVVYINPLGIVESVN